jgi:hypothetical protein
MVKDLYARLDFSRGAEGNEWILNVRNKPSIIGSGCGEMAKE